MWLQPVHQVTVPSLRHAMYCCACAAGDDGADALAAAIASSPCLKKLKLSGNSITAAQLEVVQHVLKTREYRL